jgi:hypothetical protein
LPWDRQIFIDGKFYSVPGMSIITADSAELSSVPGMPTAAAESGMPAVAADSVENRKSEISSVAVGFDGEKIELKNRFLTAIIDRYGRIESLKVHRTAVESRQVIVPGQCGNQFMIYDDVPLYWDAWDVMDVRAAKIRGGD